MKPDRRQVLQGLASGATLVSAGLSSGCKDGGSDTGEDVDLISGDWEPGGTADMSAFPSGIQSGDATADSIILAVRTGEQDVTIEVVEIRTTGWRQMYSQAHSPTKGTIQVEVGGLVPDQLYTWVAWADSSKRSIQGWFRTALAPGNTRVIRFGAISCMGGNEPWPCLSRAAEQNLDVFLLLGDTIYADWGTFTTFKDKWTDALEQSGLIDLSASTSLISTWDDHEVDNNWNPDSTGKATVDEARDAFRQAIPQRTGPDDAIWHELSWGDAVSFFVLDCRGERKGNKYVSKAQMDWLKSALSASKAQFKVILNSVPITDLSHIPIYGTLEQDDRWQGYPEQREELLAHCKDIPGVFFVSGDFHVGAAAIVDAPENAGAELIEILAGPGGSPISEQYSLVPEGGRIPKVVLEHNYTLFECEPATGKVRVEWINNDGDSVRSYLFTP